MALRRAVLSLLAFACWLASASFASLAVSVGGESELRGLSVPARQAESMLRAEARAEVPALFTLWEQRDAEQLEAPALGRTARSDVLLLAGDSRLVLPFGAALPAGDRTGCLLGRDTAYALFGDWNPVGAAVRYRGHDYTVRGVLETPRTLAVFPGKTDASYSMLSLSSGADADAFSTRHRLSPTLRFQTALAGDWSVFFASLPVWAAAWALFAALLRTAKLEREYPVRSAALLAVAGVFGIAAIGVLAGTLPVSREILPTRWSDFGYWRVAAESWRAQAAALFAMKKCAPDLLRIVLFAKSALGGLCAFWLTRKLLCGPAVRS